MHLILGLAAWSLISLIFLNTWTLVRDIVTNAKQMYQIPCANCQFFIDNPFLKCTVHPTIALTEDAIHCRDYS
jgi:hypothetical protein